MNAGDRNRNGQILVRKTNRKSTTHAFARIWEMKCAAAGHVYGSNSCDAHIRRCPICDSSARPPEPIA